MSTIAIPAWFGLDGFAMWSATTQRSFASPFGGSEQVIDLLNDRWMASLSVPPRIFSEAASLEAFVASFRGMNNTIALYHFLRPQPRGTMRGSPTSQAAAAGAGALTINTTAGATLLAGDMIGVSGLLLQVAADTVANGSGVMAVSIINRLRTAVSASTPVVWDKPTAPFRLASRPFVQFVPGYAQGVDFDFVEAIG